MYRTIKLFVFQSGTSARPPIHDDEAPVAESTFKYSFIKAEIFLRSVILAKVARNH